ncbi:general secretion pathway protein GspD [Fusobacterium sp.]|uniref:SpaA isopeptide-forming pilin-related protein n=1 Tax=Fusobacterium sp. TaxID=68766 RepID=UPI002610C135|nr:general secretion pathway protein GspD [Fusobacterium sp.]
MKRILRISFCFIFFFFIQNFTFTEKIIDTEKIIYKEEINIVDMKVSDFLFYLSKEGKIEIVSEDSIKDKKINMFCKEGTSLNKILLILCESNEWKAEKEKGYIFISPRNIQREGRGEIIGKVSSFEYQKNMEGAKITLLDNYSKPVYTDINGTFRFENIPYGVYFIRAEKNGYKIEGEMVDVNKKNNVVKIFMEKDYKENNNISKKETEDNDFIIEKVKFSDVKDINIENMIAEDIKEGINFSKNMDKGIIYISGEKKKVLRIKKYLEELDSHNKQVRITAQILDVTENLFEDLGFSWLYGGNSEKSKDSISAGVLTSSSTLGVGSLFSSVFTLIKNFNDDEDILKVSFNLLQGTQDLTISAVPSIVTTSGKEGIFKITEERIIGQEKTENDENGKTTYTPIFREAGIILNVTPEIMKDDTIVLKINLETSDFKMQNYISDESSSNNSENIGGSKVSRNIETTVRLKSGDTVFIGGLKKGIIQNSESRVPFISSVPVVGNLFKNSSERKEVTDLYIRLKVDIVKDGGFSDAGMETFQQL